MPRYFYKEAAGTPLRLLGEYVYFTPVGHAGGSIQGVLSADGPLAKELDGIAERFGIVEITEDKFNALVAPSQNVTYTRAVDAMQPVLPQPGDAPKAKKAEPIKDDPRAVVKVGKA